MSNPELNSLDDYEQFVRNVIKPWSREQRIALTAAMAERWLPVYESFSEKEEWGDPSVFQHAVEDVWNCALGKKLSNKDHRRHKDRVEENTPHLDDFDAEEVIATSAMIHYALSCCVSKDNTDDIVMAMVSGFEGVAPGIYTDAEELPQDLWRLPHVQDELAKQLELLKLIDDMAQIDQKQINALREKVTSSELVGTESPRPDPSMTNEAVFEQYRRSIESDLKHKFHWEKDNSYLNALNDPAIIIQYVSEWGSRYSRRKFAIEKNPMLDVVARNALLTRYSKNDAAVKGDPGWDGETRSLIELCYRGIKNMVGGLDTKTPEEAHSYGPSLRQLSIERRLTGDTNQDVWNNVLQWARHWPPAWEEEDRRKKKKLAYATPELGARLTRDLSWHDTNDVNYPWSAEVAGETWRVGLNDFPDDLVYTLIINDQVIGKFHDWPENWLRENRQAI